MKQYLVKLLFLFFLGLASGCSSISHFDKAAYEQITAVEASALSLMDKAVEDYSIHEKKVQEVQDKMQEAYLYDKNRPKNKITAEMWQVIIDPQGQSFGSFITRWMAEKKLGKTFIIEAKKKVQDLIK